MDNFQEIKDMSTIKESYKSISDNNTTSPISCKSTIPSSFAVPSKQPSILNGKNTMNYDDAISLTKMGIFNYLLIALAGTILTAGILETISIAFILPVSECDLKLTTPEKGVLGAIGLVGTITSSHLWGFLADTTGRRKVMIPTLFLTVLCSVASSVSNNYTVFLIFRFFNGFFMSCPTSVIYAYLGEFHNTKNRSRTIMFASILYGITGILIPVIAYFVINQSWEFFIPIINVTYKPWRSFIVVSSMPSLLCAIGLIFLPESPKYLLSIGQEKAAIKIIKLIYRINNCKKVPVPEIESIVDDMDMEFKIKMMNTDDSNINIKKNPFVIFKIMWKQTIPIFMDPYIKTTCIIFTMQFFNFITCNGLYVWLPEVLNRMAEYMNAYPNEQISACEIMHRRSINITDALLNQDKNNDTFECNTQLEIETMQYTLFLEIGYTIGFTILGALINVVGKLPLIVTISVVSGFSGFLIAFIKVPSLSSYFVILLDLSGLIYIVTNAATVDLYPTNIRAMAVSMSQMVGRLGGVFGTSMAGLLLDNYCEYLFSISGTLLIAMAVLVFFLPNIRKKSTKKSHKEHTDVENNKL